MVGGKEVKKFNLIKFHLGSLVVKNLFFIIVDGTVIVQLILLVIKTYV